MRNHIGIVRRIILFSIALVLVAGHPLTAMADTQEPTTATTPATVTTEEAPSESTPVASESLKPTYTYDPVAERWNSEKWQYNQATNAYETPPQPVIVAPPVVEKTDEQTKSTTTADTSVTVDNNLESKATSGDSAVAKNTAAGSATTGDAVAIATMMNSVNSSINTGNNEKVATFTQDIMGDLKGDIILYPMLLKAMLEAQAGNASSTIGVNNNLQLNNNVNIDATSGNAAVTGNTSAGNATTGSAHAVANVVNILNSMIAAQESFIGTINIYGNLEGDILIAPDFIPQMLANNGGTDSETVVSSKDAQTIVNNISAVAESGAAKVFGNTAAGNATTGSADSNIVIFNLSGHEVIAKNSLLVFVNVLGKWVGVIVDAPTGATAAMIGNGVTGHTTTAPDLSVTSESTHGITNTIAVNARSGDAEVSKNTQAGNATTGHAKAMANVANVSESQFGLSDWFGVLFINVFQNWHGSFGINTIYGNEAALDTESPTGPVQFAPTGSSTNDATRTVLTVIDSRTFAPIVAELAPIMTESAPVVLAATTVPAIANATEDDRSSAQPVELSYDYRIFIIAGSILMIGLSSLGFKRLFG